jgi:hypothetical protein
MCVQPFHVLLLILAISPAASAAPDPGLEVRKVLGAASAPPQTALPPGTLFSTGLRSKSELASRRGVVRVGEQAEVHALSTGVALSRGTTVVASEPKGLRKTIEVRAPGYRMQVKGTVQIAFDPGRTLKIAVLEGQVTVALDSVLGEFESLTPGQMLIINPSDHRLPEPVDIDVQRLAATSALVSGELGALSTADKIKAASGGQALSYASGALLDSALLLRGLNNSVEIERAHVFSAPARRPPAAEPVDQAQSLFHAIDDLSDPHAVTIARTFVFPDSTAKAALVADQTFARDDFNPGRTQVLNVELTQHKLRRRGFPTVSDAAPTISGVVTVDPGFFSGANQTLRFSVVDRDDIYGRLQITPGATVTTPPKVGLTFEVNLGLDVTGATLAAGVDPLAAPVPDAAQPLLLSSKAGGITVTAHSELKGSQISLMGGDGGGDLIIDQSRLTAKKKINLGEAARPTGITVRNSSELQSLAANIQLLSLRNAINLESGAKLTARNGSLLIDAFIKELKDAQGVANTTPGVVTIKDATLVAKAIRARGYANGGDALVIDGSDFTATQLLKLFAEGASTLRFKNKVTLTTPTAILAGKIVQVDSGGLVDVSGKARVYTDDDRYNRAGFGSIQAKGGLSPKLPYSKRGRFNP